MHRSRNVNDPNLSIRDVLRSHIQSEVDIKDIPCDRQRILVRRKHIWADTKRALQRPSFDSRIGIHIVFIGEEAQDAGGPLREYFRLLWRDIAGDGCLFAGSEEGRVLTHNMMSLQKGDYALVGRCIGMALLYGGSGPHFFPESVTSYVFNEPVDCSARNDIPDYEIREKIDKVSQG
jgi:hypothetical protein